MASPGLIPQIQSLASNFVQNPANTISTSVSGVLSGSSLTTLLGAAGGLAAGSKLGGIIGTAQGVLGVGSAAIGAASALGINVSALNQISQSVLGVNVVGGTTGSSATFSLAPTFKNKLQPSVNQMKYPLDLDSDDGVRISFFFKEYDRASPHQTSNYSDIKHSITLPIPPELVDAYQVGYNDLSIGPIYNMAMSAGKSLSDSSTLGDITNKIGGAISSGVDMVNKDPSAGVQMGMYGAAKLSTLIASVTNKGPTNTIATGMSDVLNGGAIQALSGNFFGRIINPSTTVSLQGIALRSHRFSWTFAPKSQDESAALQKILLTFKRNMLPTSQDNGFFLKYPMICSPRFFPNDSVLYQFKPCVVTNVVINNAGGGTPAFFFDNKSPVIIQFTIDLKEIEMVTSNDIIDPDTINISPESNPTTPATDDETNILPQNNLPQVPSNINSVNQTLGFI